MDPKGKVVVVTGAANGIGAAIVHRLVEVGASAVIATDLEYAPLEAMAATVENVLPRQLDVADEAATKALVEQTEREVGPIDIWFANAGIFTMGAGLEAPDTTWDRYWHVHVLAHTYAARALLPGWTARRAGHLVTTASLAGLLTSVDDVLYATTKHAAIGFAEWMAITYAKEGIKVSCICPGAVDTPMMRRGSLEGDTEQASARVSAGDVMKASEAAERIVQAVVEDRFIIYTHPELHKYVERKSSDIDAWIGNMVRSGVRDTSG